MRVTPTAEEDLNSHGTIILFLQIMILPMLVPDQEPFEMKMGTQ